LQLRVFEITFSGILILAPHINDVWEQGAEENIFT
jgi:hypothetical protein